MESRRLTPSQVKTLTAPGMYSDGQGLNLRIKDTGGKSWVQRVTIDGKRVNLGLGAFPTVSLSNARTIADANAETIGLGMDPRQAKPTPARKSGKAKTITTAPESTAPTFSEAADAFMTLRRSGLADGGQQWAANLQTYVYPAIGRKPVDKSPAPTCWPSLLRYGLASRPLPRESASAPKTSLITPSQWAGAVTTRQANT